MMPVVFREVGLAEEQEPLEAPRSASTLQAQNHHIREDASSTHGGPSELYWGSTSHKRGTSRLARRLRGRICWGLLFLLIPAIIISGLRAVCIASVSVSTNGATGTSIRRLSDSDENKQEHDLLSQLVEECAALEAELGIPVSQDSNPAQALDTAEQVARIAFALYQEAASFEQDVQQSQPAGHTVFPPLAPYPPSSGMQFQHQQLEGLMHRLHQRHAAEGSHHSPYVYTTSEHQHGGHLPELLIPSHQLAEGVSEPALSSHWPFVAHHSPFFFTPVGAFESPERDAVAFHSVTGPQPSVAASQSEHLLHQAAALLPQGAGRRRKTLKRRFKSTDTAYPEVNPNSWLDVPVAESSPEGQTHSRAPSHEQLSPDQAVPCSSAACQFQAGDAETGLAIQSSSTASAGDAEASAAVTAPPAASEATSTVRAPAALKSCSDAICVLMHPYVHLPVLKEGVSVPPIRLSDSSFKSTNGASVREILVVFRRLFMKKEVGQMEAALLVAYIQELAVASAARARGTKRMNRPLHGVMTIGRHFLVLDAMVSAMHVLRVSAHSCEWWGAFTRCFDTDYRYTAPGQRTKNSGRVNIDLANRLLAAMATYKTGNRPDPCEIIDLKRILFFSKYAPTRFRSSDWDLWRDDFRNFERENPSVLAFLMWRRHLPP